MDPRRMCPHCRAFITTDDKVCPYCNERVGPRAVERDGPSVLAGFIPRARFNTVIILLINFGLYVATALYSMRGEAGGAMDIDARTLLLFGAKFGPALELGQWWRLVTANFLHGGLIHILMNSWVMFDLGATVEEVYGASRMYVIYLVAGIAGFYLSALWRPGSVSIGASASIFGLLGAMVALGMRHRNAIGDAMRGQYVRWIVYMLLFGLFMPGIDMAAHVGGLAGGFATAYIAGEPRHPDSQVETGWKVAAWVAVLLTAYCFLRMYLSFSRFAG
jgi:rhomboid protease GluP